MSEVESYLSLLDSHFKEDTVSSPRSYLIIDYEIMRWNSFPDYAQRFLTKGAVEARNISFILTAQGNLMCKKLEILSDDLLDFCQKLYYSAFATCIHGIRSAEILEYDFLKNAIVIHNPEYGKAVRVGLTEKNIHDIKTIADPRGRDFCVLY